MKQLLRLFITLIAFFPLAAMATTPPAWINFQGRLLDNNGIPVTATNMAFTVSLWTDAVSTLPADLKYRESHYPISVDDGVYSFPVGSGTPISGSYGGSLYANNNVLWMEIAITPEGQSAETLSPRHRLLSAPYTNHSGNSENLGGQPISYFGTAAQVSSLNSQISTINSALQAICENAGNIWTGSSCEKGLRVLIDNQNGGYIPIEGQPTLQIFPQYANNHSCTEAFYGHNTTQFYAGVVNCDGVNTWSDPDAQGCGFGKVTEAIVIKESDCQYPIPNPGGG